MLVMNDQVFLVFILYVVISIASVAQLSQFCNVIVSYLCSVSIQKKVDELSKVAESRKSLYQHA